jgi:hypothetical protein
LLNAVAMRLFGVNLLSMRIALFFVFALWVPALFWIATRFTRPILAAPFVALAVSCSLPVYPAPMPSWYTLFFTTFGVAAFLRWLECGGRWWIAAAGACAGLATLAKITGLHFAAAASLFLAWREPVITAAAARGQSGRVYPIALTIVLAAFVGGLVAQVHPIAARHGWGPQLWHFVLPGALVAGLVAHRCWTRSDAAASTRFLALFRSVAPFALGMAAPLLVFAAPYVLRGSLTALIHGALVVPARRLELATTVIPPASLAQAVMLVPLAALAFVPLPRGRLWPKLALPAALAAFAGSLWLAREAGVPYWAPVFLPIAAFAAWRLFKRGAESDPLVADRVMAVLAPTAPCSLVQFPFTVSVYFFYFAPLMVLTVVAVFSLDQGGIGARPGLVLAAVLIAVIMLSMRRGAMAPLATARCALRVNPVEAREYDRVLEVLRSHVRGGWVWAGPDAPEVPFLSGLRNPTRTIFDCFDRDFRADPGLRAERLMDTLDSRGVNAVAVNLSPGFSGQLRPEIVDAIRSRFPNYEVVGKFVVAWR